MIKKQTKNKSAKSSNSFLLGLLGVSVGILFLFVFVSQSGLLSFKETSPDLVYAGKAGLPGNNKDPQWYTTCTGATPDNPDQTPPTATLTNPVDGTYVSRGEIVNFYIDSTDNVQLNRNELHVNDVYKGVIYSDISPYVHGWKVPPNANKGTTFKVYSKTCDRANNFATTALITLIVK